jgi:hypothetical protein
VNIRPQYFSRQGWYPGTERECRKLTEEYLKSFPGAPLGQLAGIVPHAGWVFSGRTAAWTFAALQGSNPQVVFLFGGHLRPGEPSVIMPEGAFDTPLGPIPVEEEIASAFASRFKSERETPQAYSPDNTIELQLPLLKAVWPDARVVAAQVPPGPEAEDAGRWAAEIGDQKKLRTVAIGSTDLTHYGPNYGFSPKGAGEEALRWSKEENDRPLLDHLLKLDPSGAMRHALQHHSACCSGAAAAAVSFARARGATQGQLVQHTTSHEVEGRGKPTMWVGYASVVF